MNSILPRRNVFCLYALAGVLAMAGGAFFVYRRRRHQKNQQSLEDVAGDRLRGEHTLPLRWGRTRAGWIATAIYLLLLAIAWIPYVAGIYGAAYAIALVPFSVLVIYVLVQLHSHHPRLGHGAKIAADCNDHRLGHLLKIGMFLGLLAILIGELGFD